MRLGLIACFAFIGCPSSQSDEPVDPMDPHAGHAMHDPHALHAAPTDTAEPDPHAHHHPAPGEPDPHAQHHDHGAMLLTHVSQDVGLALVDAPQVIGVGPTKLTLALIDRTHGGKPLTDLRRAPELQVVVYLVREDLASFARFDAVPSGNGTFTIAPTFETAGDHRLYATLDSASLGFHIASLALLVEGPVAAPSPLLATPAVITVGDVTATLSVTPSPLVAGDVSGELSLADTSGNPIVDLEPMRDELVEAFILGTDLTTISRVHVHGRTPVAGQRTKPTLRFHTRLAPGMQSLFFIVQRAGKPVTLRWNVNPK